MAAKDYRTEFLLRMYDQLWNSINVRITGMWQCTGVLAGALLILALVEEDIVSLDIAVTIIVLLAGWLLLNIQDASYWYNRNLCIVANIEKQMLTQDDARKIHFYMGEHGRQKMIAHLKIQFALGTAIGCIFILYHLTERVLPGLTIPRAEAQIDLKQALPYVALAFMAVMLICLKRSHKRKYAKFLKRSPGEWQRKTDAT